MNASVRTATITLIILVANFSTISCVQAQSTAMTRKPIAESRLKLPEYFGFYAVRQNGEVIMLDHPTQSLDEVPALTLPEDTEFLVYGRDINSCEFSFFAIPGSQTENTQPSSPSLDDRVQEMSGIPRGAREKKLLLKPVVNQSQMVRLIPDGTLPKGAYQVGSADDKWYRFVVGNASGQSLAQGGNASQPTGNKGSRVGSASVQTPEKARNIAEVEKAKAVLTLPASCGIAGAMGADKNTVITSGEGLRNLLKALGIKSLSELAVDGEVVNVGDLNTRAYYSAAKAKTSHAPSANGQVHRPEAPVAVNPSIRAELKKNTVFESTGPRFFKTDSFRTHFMVSNITEAQAYKAIVERNRVLAQEGRIRDSSLNVFPEKVVWFADKKGLGMNVLIKKVTDGNDVEVSVRVSGIGATLTPKEDQAIDEVAAVYDVLEKAGGMLKN